MSWTYDDDLHVAVDNWTALPEGAAKNKLATRLLKRYQSIRREDCGFCRLPEAYPDSGVHRYNVRPPIPKELR